MRKTLVLSFVVALLLGGAVPAVANGASVERIEEPFVSVVATNPADNAFGVGLMLVECDFLIRVELPDGSARETMRCVATEPFLEFGPEFAGQIPDRAFNDAGGECIWFSDYWGLQGQDVVADRYHTTTTPRGRVHATSWYPADPIDPAGCE